MKERYVIPAIEVIEISNADIITESNCITKLPDIPLEDGEEG